MPVAMESRVPLTKHTYIHYNVAQATLLCILLNKHGSMVIKRHRVILLPTGEMDAGHKDLCFYKKGQPLEARTSPTLPGALCVRRKEFLITTTGKYSTCQILQILEVSLVVQQALVDHTRYGKLWKTLR